MTRFKLWKEVTIEASNEKEAFEKLDELEGEYGQEWKWKIERQ